MCVIRKLFRRLFRLALIAGIVAFFVKLFRKGDSSFGEETGTSSAGKQASGSGSTSAPTTATSTTASTSSTTTDEVVWVAPEGEACPASHPVKVKEASGIFHVPGGLAYDRTAPDRCYPDVASAEADGFRQAKR